MRPQNSGRLRPMRGSSSTVTFVTVGGAGQRWRQQAIALLRWRSASRSSPRRRACSARSSFHSAQASNLARWAIRSSMVSVITRAPMESAPTHWTTAPAPAAPDLHPHDIMNAIADYTSGSTYHRAMIMGAARVDLDGAAVGTVNGRHAARAARALEQRRS